MFINLIFVKLDICLFLEKKNSKSAPKNVLHPSFTMLIEFGFENTPVKYISDLLKQLLKVQIVLFGAGGGKRH